MTTLGKFGRTYLLSIQGNNGSQTIYSVQPPLTLEFEVVRNMWGGANSGKFKIYNLAEKTRNNLFHVRYDTAIENAQTIRLFAGYESRGNVPMVFFGNVRRCSTMRKRVDWITDIDAWDGGLGMILGQISLEKSGKDWSAEEILRTISGTMPYVQFGAVGDISIKSSRGISMAGNSWDIARKMVGSGCLMFVDNGMSYAIKETEYLVKPGATELIVGPNNILGTPRIDAGIMEVDMIFEPSVFVAQSVSVTSLNSIYNGTYQLRGFRHAGTISGAICDKAITTLQLWTGVLGVRNRPKLTPVQAK